MRARLLIGALVAAAAAAAVLYDRAGHERETTTRVPVVANESGPRAVREPAVRVSAREARPSRDESAGDRAITRTQTPTRLSATPPPVNYRSSISRTAEQRRAWNRLLAVLADNLEPEVAEEVAAIFDDACSFRIHDPEFQKLQEKLVLTEGDPEAERAIAYEYAAYKRAHSGLSKVGEFVPDIETRRRIAAAIGDFQESCPD